MVVTPVEGVVVVVEDVAEVVAGAKAEAEVARVAITTVVVAVEAVQAINAVAVTHLMIPMRVSGAANVGIPSVIATQRETKMDAASKSKK